VRDEIFNNSDEILALHEGILHQLEILVGSYNPDTSIIGESFVQLAPYLKVNFCVVYFFILYAFCIFQNTQTFIHAFVRYVQSLLCRSPLTWCNALIYVIMLCSPLTAVPGLTCSLTCSCSSSGVPTVRSTLRQRDGSAHRRDKAQRGVRSGAPRVPLIARVRARPHPRVLLAGTHSTNSEVCNSIPCVAVFFFDFFD
jgi:hypothetical protein